MNTSHSLTAGYRLAARRGRVTKNRPRGSRGSGLLTSRYCSSIPTEAMAAITSNVSGGPAPLSRSCGELAQLGHDFRDGYQRPAASIIFAAPAGLCLHEMTTTSPHHMASRPKCKAARVIPYETRSMSAEIRWNCTVTLQSTRLAGGVCLTACVRGGDFRV